MMSEYFDLGTNLQGLVESVQDFTQDITSYWTYSGREENNNNNKKHHPQFYPTPKSFLEVRNSICVVGYHRGAVQEVKNMMSELLPVPVALESFTVKKSSDVKDGAFLVPKVVLVGLHCAGRKLLDEEEDEGQLDILYDEASEVGADIMVVYLGLPKVIYKPMRHIVYHPKMSEMLFPSQPLLKHLAEENCFITVTERSEFSNMQKNVLREWMTKPVGKEHPVYKTADYLSSMSDAEMSDAEFFSSDTHVLTMSPETPEGESPDTFQPATEEHPLADKAKKKKKKEKKKRFSFRRKKESPVYRRTDVYDDDDYSTMAERQNQAFDDASYEMNVYRDMDYTLEGSAHMHV